MNLLPLHKLGLCALLALAPLVGLTAAQDHGGAGDEAKPTRPEVPTKPAKKVFAGEPYLLDLDVVTGESLGPLKDQVVVEYEGRELRFSSRESLKTFRAEPAGYLERIDALMIADQLPYYPIDVCMISCKPLDSKGEPIDGLYKNRLVRLCCKSCVGKFRKDPDTYIAQLDKAAIKAQTADYPIDKCLISKEELGSMGDPIDRIIGGRLVRLCCKSCNRKVTADPAKFVGQVDAARAAARKAAERREGAHEEGERGKREQR